MRGYPTRHRKDNYGADIFGSEKLLKSTTMFGRSCWPLYFHLFNMCLRFLCVFQILSSFLTIYHHFLSLLLIRHKQTNFMPGTIFRCEIPNIFSICKKLNCLYRSGEDPHGIFSSCGNWLGVWTTWNLRHCRRRVVVGPTHITATTVPVGPWVSRDHTLTHT